MGYKWIFDADEFTPEYRHNGQSGVIEVMKVGGGTLGGLYYGAWLFRVFRPGSWEILDQDEYENNDLLTHEAAAKDIDEYLMSEKEADNGEATCNCSNPYCQA